MICSCARIPAGSAKTIRIDRLRANTPAPAAAPARPVYGAMRAMGISNPGRSFTQAGADLFA
jgi:hypothetical protein